MKKNSTKMKLLSAAGMLAISAAMLATSTYAWFTMNTEVSVTGMRVKAKAEKGLLVSNVDKTSWTNSASGKTLGSTETAAVLYPTNTNGSLWAHAKSTAADEAQALQLTADYEDLTIAWSDTTNSCGYGYVEKSGTGYAADADDTYILSDVFYLKSSADALTTQDLYVKGITVTGASKKIDAALRVLLVVTDGSGTSTTTNFFAPVGATAEGVAPLTSFKYKNSGDALTAITGTSIANTQIINDGTIGNTDATAAKVQVYLYFEGEDPNCKSTNISGIEMDTLGVTIDFSLETTTTP